MNTDLITKDQAISAKILSLVLAGESVDKAVDAVLGAGTYAKLASELFDQLSGR